MEVDNSSSLIKAKSKIDDQTVKTMDVCEACGHIFNVKCIIWNACAYKIGFLLGIFVIGGILIFLAFYKCYFCQFICSCLCKGCKKKEDKPVVVVVKE
jgi:hypothetical protein